MLEQQPRWRFDPSPESPWIPGLLLCQDYVLGILAHNVWFCLQRQSGELLWQQKMRGRPNTIKALCANVIIASEYRSDGPWGAEFGVYGIDFNTRKLLWTSHAPGRWGNVVRALDFVPDFTNELRDSPLSIMDGRVITKSGRVLNTRNGAEIERIQISEEIQRGTMRPTRQLLFRKEVPCGNEGTLRAGTPDEPEEMNCLQSNSLVRFHLQNPDGEVVWQFDASQHQDIGDARYYTLDFEYSHPWIYLLVRDRRTEYEKSKRGQLPGCIPALYFLWTLDTRSGEIAQKIQLPGEPTSSCRIKACDKTGLVVSYLLPDEKHQSLLYFACCSS